MFVYLSFVLFLSTALFFVLEKKELCKLGNCYLPKIVRWKGLNQCNGLVQTFPRPNKVAMQLLGFNTNPADSFRFLNVIEQK